MPISPSLLLTVGICILVHAFFMAYSIKDRLQNSRYERGTSTEGLTGEASLLSSSLSSTSTYMLVIAVEACVGVVVIVYGYAKRSVLRPARLVDVNKMDRYDRCVQTGIGFIHFNHRGKLNAQQQGKGKPSEEKKRE